MKIAVISGNRAIVIRHVSDDPNWRQAELQSIVGGAIETVAIDRHPRCLGLIAEGARKPRAGALPAEINEIGTRLLLGEKSADVLVSPLVIVGTDAAGAFADIPPDVVSTRSKTNAR